MAPTLAPYSAAYINTLPIQVAALVAFEQHNASEAVYGPLQDVFAKHSATKFGLRVIHKLVATGPSPEGPPADQKAATAAEQVLKDSDRIIRSNNVALVVDINALSQEALDKLVPITWGFKDDGSIFPLEFALSADPAKDKLTSADLAFFADVQSVLTGKPYASILGLSLAAYQSVGVKVTRGPVSITLPFELVDLFEGDTRRETAWGFVGGELQVQGLICVTRGAQSYATSVYGGYYGYGDRCNSWGRPFDSSILVSFCFISMYALLRFIVPHPLEKYNANPFAGDRRDYGCPPRLHRVAKKDDMRLYGFRTRF